MARLGPAGPRGERGRDSPQGDAPGFGKLFLASGGDSRLGLAFSPGEKLLGEGREGSCGFSGLRALLPAGLGPGGPAWAPQSCWEISMALLGDLGVLEGLGVLLGEKLSTARPLR